MFTVFGKPVFSLCRWTNWKYPHCLKKHSVKRFTNETPHIYTLERITGSSCKQNSVIVILSNAFYKALHGYVTKGVEPPSYQEIKKKKHEATCLQRNHQLWITFSVRAHNFIEVWKYSKWFWMRFCCLKSLMLHGHHRCWTTLDTDNDGACSLFIKCVSFGLFYF